MAANALHSCPSREASPNRVTQPGNLSRIERHMGSSPSEREEFCAPYS